MEEAGLFRRQVTNVSYVHAAAVGQGFLPVNDAAPKTAFRIGIFWRGGRGSRQMFVQAEIAYAIRVAQQNRTASRLFRVDVKNPHAR